MLCGDVVCKIKADFQGPCLVCAGKKGGVNLVYLGEMRSAARNRLAGEAFETQQAMRLRRLSVWEKRYL